MTINADLHSNTFDLVPGDSRSVEFMPGYSGRTTDDTGAVTFEFYPSTGTTFDVTATNVVDGVTLTNTVTAIATTVTSVDITLPSALQTITGSILDTDGNPVPGLTVYASNTIGNNSAVTDDNGGFAFAAPPGAVNVAVCVTDGGAWWSIMQGPPNFANPAIPDLVECLDPVSWQSSDGDLNFTMPVAFPIHVNVTDSNGQPVAAAQVSMSTTITSDPFDLLPGVSRTVDFVPGYSGRTSDVNGEVSFQFYPSTATTFAVNGSATINGVSLIGQLLDAPANATATFTFTIPGTTDLAQH